MLSDKTVLIIEDDPLLNDIYTTAFKHEGFRVKSALSGEGGLEIMDSNKPDVIVLDLLLTNMQGQEVLDIMKCDARLDKTIFVVVTNMTCSGVRKELLGCGVHRYMIKAHYCPSEVCESVKKCLQCEEQHNCHHCINEERR